MRCLKTVLFIIAFVLSSFFIAQETSFAAGSVNITSGGTYYLDDYEDDFIVYINTTESVTISQKDSDRVFYNLAIHCRYDDASVTIEGLNIRCDSGSPIVVLGYDCTISLSGESTLLSEGEYPAVRVSAGAKLTINGDGSLYATGGNESAGIGGISFEKNGYIIIDGDVYIEAYGGYFGAGIGSGRGVSSGNIRILSGTIVAEGGYASAGIGGTSPAGSNPASGGTITIEGGNVCATGGYWGQGIGGYAVTIVISGGTVEAHGADSGSGIGTTYGTANGGISISGGTVTAYGSTLKISNYYYSGAGIGGSNSNATASISITGGTVTAYGGLYAAGIGSGNDSVTAGTISIYGGTVFASGNGLADDIGDGADCTAETTLSLYGDYTKVFLEHDTICSVTTTHVHNPLIYVDENNYAYGWKMPDNWNTASLYVTKMFTLTYDANGADGTTPDSQVIVPEGYAFLRSAASLSYDGMYFAGWNTNPSGAKEMVYPNDYYQMTGDVTLYAVWKTNVATISLSQNTLNLTIGGANTLTATAENPTSDYDEVYWTSSDPSVAGVNQSGKVVGIGSGTATITAYFSGKSATCTVTVSSIKVTDVDLDYSSIIMYEGDQRILTAEVSPSDATDTDVSWKSSDTSVATVNDNGVITAVSQGTASITAASGGITESCYVTVNASPDVAVTGVILSSGSNSVTVMYVGDTISLNATVMPSDASDKNLTWQSSDSSVITVGSTGKVTAVAAGDASVIVSAQGGVSDTYKITVLEASYKELEASGADTNDAYDVSDTDILLTFEIDTSNLPYGAEYIQLPDGEIIGINGEDTLSVTVSQDYICDGCLELIALDGEKTSLGSVGVEAESGTPLFVIILLAVGAMILGVGGTLLVVRVFVSKK